MRTYRVRLEVDITIEAPDQFHETWEDVEAHLETTYNWEAFVDDYPDSHVRYADLDSYVED